MAMYNRFFYPKPPDGLLEITERVYVFDCCLSTDVLNDKDYKAYMSCVVAQLHDYSPNSPLMVFNFRQGDDKTTQISDILSEFNNTSIMEYPMQYENCSLLPLQTIHHFLESAVSWLSLDGRQSILLIHCERGGWSVLSFFLATLLMYTKKYNSEKKALEMVYKQSPSQILRLLTPLNPKPSQLRYLHYMGLNLPPSDTPLVMDSIVIKSLPVLHNGNCCRLVVHVYGQEDPSTESTLLFSSLKARRRVRTYPEMELVILGVGCRVGGDVVLECVHLCNDSLQEEIMFRVMFHTAFIRSCNMAFSCDEVDILWDAEDMFTKDFRTEVLFSEVGADTNMNVESEDETGVDVDCGEEFFEDEDIFGNVVDETDLDVACRNQKADSKPVYAVKMAEAASLEAKGG